MAFKGLETDALILSRLTFIRELAKKLLISGLSNCTRTNLGHDYQKASQNRVGMGGGIGYGKLGIVLSTIFWQINPLSSFRKMLEL